MDLSNDFVLRILGWLMATSCLSAFAVFRFYGPPGVWGFWHGASGLKRAGFHLLLLLACWLPSFCLVMFLINIIPSLDKAVIASAFSMRMLVIFSSVTVVWLLFYWGMLKSVPR